MIKKLLFAAILVGGAAAAFIFTKKGDDKQQTEFETAKISTANIGKAVTATGTIEPVTKVDVGTQVSGIVQHLYVDYNTSVKRGQVIAELDKTNLLSELNSTKANLADAESQLHYQQANFNRYKTLYNKGLVAAVDYEQAQLSLRQAQESVKQRQESVKKATTNLAYATITSPISGVVIAKKVEEGQTVAASFNTPTLFTIAQDLTNMQVIADVDEADIGEVKDGERVDFTVDAYPDETFQGRVTQVRLEATTTNNVVTYQVVISARNADLKLKPGLTASVSIYTAEKNGVLSVPNKALRFTPDPEVVGPNIKIVNCKGRKKVWVKEGNTLKAIPVTTGITDGINSEVLSGLKNGQSVVTGIVVPEEEEMPGGEKKQSLLQHPGQKKDKK